MSERQQDEITPIISFIVSEMVTNAGSQTVQRIRDLNDFNTVGCINNYTRLPWWRQLLGLGITPEQCGNMSFSTKTAAFLMWADNVMQDGPWDHKPTIRRRFNPAAIGGEQVWHRYGDWLYFYDIWSNIHYGFVGAACGFTESELLDGAGWEQIGSDLARWSMPNGTPGVEGMRRFDDPSDRASIAIGMRLYPSTSTGAVLHAVTTSSNVTRRRYSPS